MTEFKSAQELILKAALYDGISTTIRPSAQGYRNAIEVVFSRDEHHCATSFDFTLDDERCVLFGLKRALFRLLENPYRDIEIKEV